MGYMLNGQWMDDDRIPADARGHFVRADSQFRSWITSDGSAGRSAAAASERNRPVITYLHHTRVHGRTERSFFVY